MKLNELYFVITIKKNKNGNQILFLTQSTNDNFEFLESHDNALIFTMLEAAEKIKFLNELWKEQNRFYAYNLNNLKL